MNAPFLLFQNWAAISGMHPRAEVWNGCLTGNSGQSMHTLHSFPTLKELSTNTTFPCLKKRGGGLGVGRGQGTDRTEFKSRCSCWDSKHPFLLGKGLSHFSRCPSVPTLFPSDRFAQGIPPATLWKKCTFGSSFPHCSLLTGSGSSSSEKSRGGPTRADGWKPGRRNPNLILWDGRMRFPVHSWFVTAHVRWVPCLCEAPDINHSWPSRCAVPIWSPHFPMRRQDQEYT